jgi:H+/Cl- antiporter ClcA
MAIGSGLAVYAIRHTRRRGDASVEALLAATGAAAALSSIFGNPLIAAVLLLEALGLTRRQTTLVMLPALVSSGIGALIFTGLGDWTGLGIGALALPDLPVAHMEPATLVWVFPVSVLISALTWLMYLYGHRVATRAAAHPLTTTIAAGVLTGICAALYTLITDHSPTEVAMSGQATLATLGADPASWTNAALILLIIFKGIAYAVCIGTFRGGPVFPALFLGGAMGVLVSTLLPGMGYIAGLAIGMAAGIAVTRLVVTSVLLVVLLLGEAATNLIPIIILAAVTALIFEELLTNWQSRRADAVQTASAPG